MLQSGPNNLAMAAHRIRTLYQVQFARCKSANEMHGCELPVPDLLCIEDILHPGKA